MNATQHNKNIINQFSKQAVPFTQLPGHLDSIQMLITMVDLKNDDTVLDVACGPGLVLCEFAKQCKFATGIDITPEMLKQAKKRQEALHLHNMEWDCDNVTKLPYEPGSFSVVITRYSFHHFLNPQEVFAEMYRVCKPGGKILIADLVIANEKVDAFNQMEKLRDSSHTSVQTAGFFEDMFQQFDLKDCKQAAYKVEMEVEKQLAASFPNEGDADKLRQIFKEDVRNDYLGVSSHYVGDEIHFLYPISIYTGTK